LFFCKKLFDVLNYTICKYTTFANNSKHTNAFFDEMFFHREEKFHPFITFIPYFKPLKNRFFATLYSNADSFERNGVLQK